jgi:DNA mismatch endonuclease (patch repair protein)
VIVLIDGCFWHGCPEHGRVPRANPEYWTAKLGRNAERDRETDSALREAGWNVVRLWEHETLDDAVGVVECALEAEG